MRMLWFGERVTISTNTLAGTALALAFATITGAWAFEIIGGLKPCQLCLIQRNPYYLGIALLLTNQVARALSHKTLARIAFYLTAATFLIGAGYGIFHSGVEWMWWAGPTACGGGSVGISSVGDLLSQLETVKVIRCDEVQWRFLGLTFANYNVLISLVIAGLSLAAARKTPPQGSSSLSQ